MLEAHRADGRISRPQLVLGVVDSGADRTVLPLSVAIRLAIMDTLERDPAGGFGFQGRPFPIWRSGRPVYGRVIADDGSARGPQFPLDPVFADADVALLGREDLFRAYPVTFQEHPATPVYHLDAA
jgi:hypothetical protein